MKDRLQEFVHQHRQFVTYSIIGLSGVAIDFIIFVILYNVFDIHPLLANLISTSFGIVNNFLLNRQFNFKTKDYILLRFLAFYATGVVGIIVSSVILRIFHDYGGFDANIVKFASIIVVVILQYSLNKAISFQDITADHASSWRIIGSFLRGNWVAILVFLNLIVLAYFALMIHAI